MSGYESVNMKALIAMSGGVDSSVAAWLTRQAGYECIGVTMKLFDNADAGISSAKTCCSLTDIQDAYSVALHLGITHHVCNFYATVPGAGHSPFRGELCPRADAESLYRVQPVHEIRTAPGIRLAARLRGGRYRALRTHNTRRKRLTPV